MLARAEGLRGGLDAAWAAQKGGPLQMEPEHRTCPWIPAPGSWGLALCGLCSDTAGLQASEHHPCAASPCLRGLWARDSILAWSPHVGPLSFVLCGEFLASHVKVFSEIARIKLSQRSSLTSQIYSPSPHGGTCI